LVPRPYRVRRYRKETHDTFTLDLVPAGDDGDFSFLPGQFNMLYVFGVGEAAISVSGDPAKPRTLVHTIRAVGSVTKVLRNLKPDQQIGVRGPFGTHWPLEEAVGKDVVVVAGGIGLAPLRPALYHLLKNRKNYGRVTLLYGTRTSDDILYQRELERWRSRFDLEVDVTVDRCTGSWHGNVGVVTTLIPRAAFDPSHTVAMICGPEVMMRFTVMELQKRGVATGSIYVSMERAMKCGVGLCGHCQFGPYFVCRDGPVFCFEDIAGFFALREI
jgi:NAD(P)H-flavin reductase